MTIRKLKELLEKEIENGNGDTNIIYRKAKYKVGDRVVYMNNLKTITSGIITEIDCTDDKTRFMYLMNNCPYLRYEEEILCVNE